MGKIGDMKISRIRAICDIWKYHRNSALAYLKNYGQEAKAHEDYRDLLVHEKGLHVTSVATPDFVHPEQVNACPKAGLDVYCEAMMAPTLAGARSTVEAMRETGQVVPYDIPVQLHQPVCQPHLESLFDAVRGKARLNCPADVALRSEVVALRTKRSRPGNRWRFARKTMRMELSHSCVGKSRLLQ